MRPPRRTSGILADPLARLGVYLMAFALAFAGAVAAYAHYEEPPERTAAKPVADPAVEPLVRSDPGVVPRKEPTVAAVTSPGPEMEEPTTAAAVAATAKPDPPPRPQAPPPEPPPEPPEPTPDPPPESPATPRPEAAPEPEPGPLPVAEKEWPRPTEDQVEETRRTRRYELPPGAVMALTVGAIGLRDAPVLRSGAPDALDRGVVHAAGTSVPWSRTPERNVYLAGHRLGWPGTGSHLVFYRLDELSDGDKVELRDREGKHYGYRVIDSFVVDPDESWVTGRVRGRDLLTLQTCVGPDWGRRLIVRAERVA